MTEDDLVDHFVCGLKLHTQTEVQLCHLRNLQEAEEHALMVDDIHYRRKHPFPTQNPRPIPPQPYNPAHQWNSNGDNMGVAPMELGNMNLRRLTEEERAQLIASGSCFKCRCGGVTKLR